MVTTHTTFFENFLETSQMQAFADWNNGIKLRKCLCMKTLKHYGWVEQCGTLCDLTFFFAFSSIDLSLILYHQLSCQV